MNFDYVFVLLYSFFILLSFPIMALSSIVRPPIPQSPNLMWNNITDNTMTQLLVAYVSTHPQIPHGLSDTQNGVKIRLGADRASPVCMEVGIDTGAKLLYVPLFIAVYLHCRTSFLQWVCKQLRTHAFHSPEQPPYYSTTACLQFAFKTVFHTFTSHASSHTSWCQWISINLLQASFLLFQPLPSPCINVDLPSNFTTPFSSVPIFNPSGALN